MTDHEARVLFAVNDLVDKVVGAVADGIADLFKSADLPSDLEESVDNLRQQILAGKQHIAGVLHGGSLSEGVRDLYATADAGMGMAQDYANASPYGLLDQRAVMANIKSTTVGLIALMLDFCLFAKGQQERG